MRSGLQAYEIDGCSLRLWFYGSACLRSRLRMIMSCCAVQDMVAELCVDYFQCYRRQAHVTPKSYLSFIGGYKAIYDARRSEIDRLAQRMNTGLTKLIEATQSVNELSKELAAKEQELEVASNKADEVLAEVMASAQAAEAVKAQVQKVKDKAQKLVDDIAASRLLCLTRETDIPPLVGLGC